MTTVSATPFTGRMATVTATGAMTGFRGLFRGALERIAYHRALAELRTLNKSELKRLGISRFALPAIARELVRGA